jgi:hypothetical protein
MGRLIEEIEKHLRHCWSDRRLFEIWSEYNAALEIQNRHPECTVTVGNRSSDVLCEYNNKKIKVEVKTGKWQTWTWDELKMTSADAVFSEYQIKNKNAFDFVVFYIHEDHQKIRENFVLNRKNLEEIRQRKGNRASPYFISRVESLEDLEKWMKKYIPPELVFDLEKQLVNNPELFRDRWDKIKFE